MPTQPEKLLDQARRVLRTKHDSYRNEQIHVDWIKRYILVHEKRHPKEVLPAGTSLNKKHHSSSGLRTA